MWNVQVPHNAWTPALFGSLGLKRSDPSFRCHSKGLAEKFDECARLPIADLGSNRLHSTSLNQQLYSFHQTHLSSPKLVARPNLSAEDSLDCPDACTNFSAQRPERWSVLLICHKGSSKPRSEEHTSELQSRLHLVCRLLLEKKKKISRYSIALRWERSATPETSNGSGWRRLNLPARKCSLGRAHMPRCGASCIILFVL